MAKPVKFLLTVSVDVSEDGLVASNTKVFVDSEQVGFIDRLRLDVDCSDILPSIEVDMLRGVDMDVLDQDIRARAVDSFEKLSLVPGLKCRMPARRRA